MVLLSLLPVGLLQTWASVEHGTWYARQREFMQTPDDGHAPLAAGRRRHHLRRRRLALGWFVLGLKTGWSFTDEELPYARDGGSPVK